MLNWRIMSIALELTLKFKALLTVKNNSMLIIQKIILKSSIILLLHYLRIFFIFDWVSVKKLINLWLNLEIIKENYITD
jgi:hypothetical protein